MDKIEQELRAKHGEPEVEFTTTDGVHVQVFGEMDVEALTRGIYGLPQRVSKKENKITEELAEETD